MRYFLDMEIARSKKGIVVSQQKYIPSWILMQNFGEKEIFLLILKDTRDWWETDLYVTRQT
jgi:hypothetical protein